MRKDSFLFHLTEEILRDLITGGIPQHLVKFYEEILYPPLLEDLAGPKVLRIDDLSYGFIIWLVSCSIAVAVFVAEFPISYLVKKFKICSQTAMGLFLFLKLLDNYLK